MNLTHCEKQVILYSKNHFYRNDLMEDLKVIAAKEYALPVDMVQIYTVYGFIIELFIKLQKEKYIKINIQDFLESLFDYSNPTLDRLGLIKKMMAEIQSVTVAGLELGEADNTLFSNQ